MRVRVSQLENSFPACQLNDNFALTIEPLIMITRPGGQGAKRDRWLKICTYDLERAGLKLVRIGIVRDVRAGKKVPKICNDI